ncbi:MAG: hypothetical protein VX961_01610 [Verrucomicrobiota bacterium]|nr:hypothetical protein [Verrucomicrobiota bacterium]
MKSALLTTITASMLIGCETQQQPSISTTHNNSLNSLKQAVKPSFEPMSLEKYKSAHPELSGLHCGIEKFFDRYINVFGVTIAAMPNTPVPEIIHSAKIYAQLLDNNEDFIPDDPKIYNYHQKDIEGRNSLIVLVDTKALDNEWIAFKPGQRFWVPAQALRPGHSGVGHSRDGEMDIAVEELFHKYGKSLQHIYPTDFGLPDHEAGETWSSTLSDAMDQARGINRKVKPVNGKWIYPRNAWYTYNDTSCEWGCQIDEYLWHIWGTNIGYYESLTRAPDRPKNEGEPGGWCDNISGEWKICSKEKLKEVDFPSFNLLNNKGYRLPTKIPYGEYGGNSVKYHGYEVDIVLDEDIRKFSINRKSNLTLTFKRGNTYYFDQSLKNNSGLYFKFSTTKPEENNKGTEYTNGVTTKGTPGNRGSYICITIDSNTPENLYIYSPEQFGIGSDIELLIKD